jgi:hypothetical protein
VIIRAKLIRRLDRYLGGISPSATVVVGLPDLERHRTRLEEVGFSEDLAPGERVLPMAVGPRSKFNAEGDHIVHKDRPKERRVVGQREWHWKEFRGRYDHEDMSRIVDVERDCYPRTFVPPPSEELNVALKTNGEKVIVADPTPNDAAHASRLLHVINLFLELFAEAELLTQHLDGYIMGEVRRLNWTLLPEGQMPWEQLKEHLEPRIRRAPGGNQPVLRHRLDTINSYGPTLHAVGHAGFSGYVVFGFPDKGLFVLESIYYGNATYVFGERWEDLSRLTKAQILEGGLEEARLIHREGWSRAVRRLLA